MVASRTDSLVMASPSKFLVAITSSYRIEALVSATWIPALPIVASSSTGDTEDEGNNKVPDRQTPHKVGSRYCT